MSEPLVSLIVCIGFVHGRNDVGWHGTTMGHKAEEDDAEILLDKSILDIPPRASLTVKLNFQQLEPPRMQVGRPCACRPQTLDVEF